MINNSVGSPNQQKLSISASAASNASGLISTLDYNRLFQGLCVGNFQAVQRLYQTFTSLIDLHHDQYKAFGFACRSGNFNLVKWLYGLGGVSNKKDDVFKMAILSGLD
jgi:hypothetical protein